MGNSEYFKMFQLGASCFVSQENRTSQQCKLPSLSSRTARVLEYPRWARETYSSPKLAATLPLKNGEMVKWKAMLWILLGPGQIFEGGELLIVGFSRGGGNWGTVRIPREDG